MNLLGQCYFVSSSVPRALGREEAVEPILLGAPDAFAQVASEYRLPLFGFFQRMLSDPAAAEDLSIKVLLIAKRAGKSLDSGIDRGVWIFRLACDLLRRIGKDAENRSIKNQSLIVQRAFGKLSFEEKTALLLHHFVRLDDRQIGLVLRLRAVASRQLVRKSYSMLHRQMTLTSANQDQ